MSILLLVLLCIIAFIAGIVIWKLVGFGDGNSFDQKAYADIMDAKLRRDDLDKAMSVAIKNMNSKTRKAVEEDMGPSEFRHYLRG